MITALDHVALAVRDLDAAVEGYARLLGVAPNWIGGDGGARHAWFQFPNMALDVIAPHGEGAFGQRLRAHLDAQGEGIWALAFTVGQVEGDLAPFARLAARRGLATPEPSLTRSTHDDGRKRYWLGAHPAVSATASLQVLLIAPPRDGRPWPLSEPAADAGPGSAVAALDHVVIHTGNLDRALAIYGARLGLDLRLDRENPRWNARQLFFRVGDAVIEIAARLGEPPTDAPDRFGGLAWRIADPDAARARIVAAGFDVSEVRPGRKPGTKVFTVRNAPAGVPTLMLSAEPAQDRALEPA